MVLVKLELDLPDVITRPHPALTAMLQLSDRYPMKGDGKFLELLLAAKIVQQAAKRPLSPERAHGLAMAIVQAFIVYRHNQFVKDVERKFSLHEIASSLAEVIANLEHVENIPSVLIALGAPASSVMFGMVRDRESAREAMAQYDIMLRGLRKLKKKIPLPPKNPRGKPPAHNLHQLGEQLADIWEYFTERKFTQGWYKERGEFKPISAGAQFVHAVVKAVDPERLKSVPDVTEQVVKRRRKASSDK